MKVDRRWCLAVTGILLFLGFGITARADDATAVRWDLVHLAFTTPLTISEGGTAFATTRNPTSLKIKLTGSGTFEPGESRDVTGGGTWVTYSGCPGACVATGSGTYRVIRLVSWEFDDLQLLVLNDLIGPNAANGNAVLGIRYSDGNKGILGIGCHGPGAHDGIVEGVIVTKGFNTYWDAAAPAAGVDANRTVFHFVRKSKDD